MQQNPPAAGSSFRLVSGCPPAPGACRLRIRASALAVGRMHTACTLPLLGPRALHQSSGPRTAAYVTCSLQAR